MIPDVEAEVEIEEEVHIGVGVEITLETVIGISKSRICGRRYNVGVLRTEFRRLKLLSFYHYNGN